ncbi:hypothetical protein [Deinococcus soli (ex Cha et al. 2016)]|uniref:phage major capsid protein n=1 Tax=Deinococcus soli (ex Cha et al. 2016) TaxID=1309411 RepID=UPI001665FC08|nr:hypothetical protein [Deinococcus soli (ex Cha et al. 2016)]GGB64498.1 hypothetical protein GCM10008019_20740 [Deinococcus soli (ex Cha et al. 2016)]
MSIKDIRHDLQRAADRGVIEQHRVIPLTIAMSLEAGQQAFHQAYYGDILDKQLESVRAMDHIGTENAMKRLEHVIPDLARTRRMHAETLTTSDFPLALAQARQFAQRPDYALPESDLIKFANRRTAPNFKPLKATRPGVLGHRFLPVRPESTNVEYTKFFTSDEGYTVADYALAEAFTWEAYINDDLGEFTRGAAALGLAARYTRASVLVDVVLRKAQRVPLLDGELGPNISNLDAVAEYMAQRVDPTTNRRVSRKPNDIFVPTKWDRLARRSMASERPEYTGGASGPVTMQTALNPVYQMANVHTEDLIEALIAEYPDRYAAKGISEDDWIAITGKPLELAALTGYEGGPRTFTRMVNVDEDDLQGDFENRNFALRVNDVIGADLSDPYGAVVAQGN